MKLAAARALAELAREDVPDSVLKAYGVDSLTFGRTYLIPKPFDPRVLLRVAPAVASAAIATGVARRPIPDMDAYRESLERILGPSSRVMRLMVTKARRTPHPKIVFPQGEMAAVLRAARAVADQHLATPILVGSTEIIRAEAKRLGLDPRAYEIAEPATWPDRERLASELFRLRERKGVTPARARALIADPTYFGLMMVRAGQADAVVGGVDRRYPETIRPALEVIGLQDGVRRLSAGHLLIFKDRLFFCADTMINIEPTAEDLAEIACLAADTARFFNLEPKVAMLAFGSFGSVKHPIAEKVARATMIARRHRPDLVIDGEMHLEVAVTPELAREQHPHSRIQGDANVLVFPDLASGNVGYQLARRLGRAEVLGPILMGMRQPVVVLPPSATSAEIVNGATIAAAMLGNEVAQKREVVVEEPVHA
jgi:malate dehydrogenase (oxaloacetate-decarboxylating)(NADP+)